jgi:hypothetical protein
MEYKVHETRKVGSQWELEKAGSASSFEASRKEHSSNEILISSIDICVEFFNTNCKIIICIIFSHHVYSNLKQQE